MTRYKDGELNPSKTAKWSTKHECFVDLEPCPSIETSECSSCAERIQITHARAQTLPTSSSARKAVPLCAGVLDYFPAALAAVARISKYGNDKHNPGEPLHWSRGKSADHADCIARHLVDRGIVDPETGESHTAELAWRALALLQLEEEERGAPQARGAR